MCHRSNMSDEKLTNLAIISIESELAIKHQVRLS